MARIIRVKVVRRLFQLVSSCLSALMSRFSVPMMLVCVRIVVMGEVSA